MTFSSKTILGLALATNISLVSSLATEDTNEILAKRYLKGGNNKKNKKNKKPTAAPTLSAYRIVSQESDLTFLPAQKAFDSGNGGPPGLTFSLPGSQYLQRGAVYDANDIEVNGNKKIRYPIDIPVAGSNYQQECTAMDGIASDDGSLRVTQNLCHHTFCLEGRGCLFLRSGGPFDFDPRNQTAGAVPITTAVSLGGTGSFKDRKGDTVTIDTISVPADNALRQAVLELKFL